MTIRLYLCNISNIITFDECRHISEILGSLFKDILTEDKRKKRNAIQLLNDMLAGESWKKHTRISYPQVLETSLAYRNLDRKMRITLNKIGRIELNVFIPLYFSIKAIFVDLLVCLSNLKASHSNDNFRFSHQIGF